MYKKRNSGTKKPELKTVKVYKETYQELVKIGSVFQLQLGEKVSFDFVIRKLIEHTPDTVVRIDGGGAETKSDTPVVTGGAAGGAAIQR